jgi:hypothetical protein
MAYEQRDLSGSLFKNDKREKDTHPNLTGTVMIGGVEYWASGWTKERANGEKWISLSFKPKEANGAHRVADVARPLPATPTPAATSDSVPF